MSTRPAELIGTLDLLPHPEGGHYREIYRSGSDVTPVDGRGSRPSLTCIHFLLQAGEHSKWHVVGSDEAWHYSEGSELELLVVEPESLQLRRLVLGPVGDGRSPVRIVPAGHWQAARSLGDYTLVGCTVGPGFVFDDFTLLREDPATADKLRSRYRKLTDLL